MYVRGATPLGGSSIAKQKAPNYWASQESGGLPIIAISALLRLAEWWENRVTLAQGGESCPGKEASLSPPAPCNRRSLSPRRTLGATNAPAATADAADSGTHRRSPDRAASKKGGGR